MKSLAECTAVREEAVTNELFHLKDCFYPYDSTKIELKRVLVRGLGEISDYEKLCLSTCNLQHFLLRSKLARYLKHLHINLPKFTEYESRS